MGLTLNFSKYQIFRAKNAIIGYYLALLILIGLPVLFNVSMEFNGGNAVFFFVLGLNLFKSSFHFSQANNISRRSFLISTLTTVLVLTGIVANLDYLFSVLITKLNPHTLYDGVFENIYTLRSTAKIFWNWALLTFTGSLGLLISMIYYRFNTLIRVLTSLSPLYVTLIWLHLLTEKTREVIRLSFLMAMGLGAPTLNPYLGGLSLFVVSALVWLINSILIDKMRIRS